MAAASDQAFWRPTHQAEAIAAYKQFISLEPRAAAAVEERIALLESSEGPQDPTG